MIKPEAKLQDIVNEGYLWLWDRTGISVSMIVLPLMVSEMPLIRPREIPNTIQWIALGILGAYCTLRHLAQMSGKFEFCNDIARNWRELSLFRWMPYFFTVPLVLLHITEWRWWADLVVVVLWVNFWGCYVRERKPREKLQLSYSTSIL